MQIIDVAHGLPRSQVAGILWQINGDPEVLALI